MSNYNQSNSSNEGGSVRDTVLRNDAKSSEDVKIQVTFPSPTGQLNAVLRSFQELVTLLKDIIANIGNEMKEHLYITVTIGGVVLLIFSPTIAMWTAGWVAAWRVAIHTWKKVWNSPIKDLIVTPQ